MTISKKYLTVIVSLVLLVFIILLLNFVKNQNQVRPSKLIEYEEKNSGLYLKYPVSWEKFGKIPNGIMLSSSETDSVLLISHSKAATPGEQGDLTLEKLAEDFLSIYKGDDGYELIHNKDIMIDGVAAKEIYFSYSEDELDYTNRLVIIKNGGAAHYISLYSTNETESDLNDFERIIKSLEINK